MSCLVAAFLAALALLGGAHAQIPMVGRCPTDVLPTQPDFDTQKYMGIWYEYARNFAVFELLDKCSRANYTLQADGKIKVMNTGEKQIFGTKNVAFGEGYSPNPNDASKLIVKLSNGPESPYWVIATDYEQYTVVYSCVNLKIPGIPLRAELLWILSRSREDFTPELLEEIYQKIDRYNITRKYLMRTDQTGCTDDSNKIDKKLKFTPVKSPQRISLF